VSRQLPVTVLTGFLGSGKTTLVNRLLKERPQSRFGLIVNEFGEAALESQLIEVRRGSLFELPSGCLCCVSDGDLKAALVNVVKKDPKIDHILVEASGLSSPGSLLGVLTNDGDFILNGVFCVVDSTSFLDREREFSAIRRQLAFADAVILTKTDLSDKVDAVRARLDELKPNVRVLDSAERLPWSALFAIDSEKPAGEASPETPKRRFFQGGTHHDTEVLEFEAETPLDPDKVREVFASLEPSILRAKGVLNLADSSSSRYKYIVQYTGTQKQLYNRPWQSDEARKTSLVFLGTGFDALALKAKLDACVAGTAV
jgi:G3E family GTPase